MDAQRLAAIKARVDAVYQGEVVGQIVADVLALLVEYEHMSRASAEIVNAREAWLAARWGSDIETAAGQRFDMAIDRIKVLLGEPQES